MFENLRVARSKMKYAGSYARVSLRGMYNMTKKVLGNGCFAAAAYLLVLWLSSVLAGGDDASMQVVDGVSVCAPANAVTLGAVKAPKFSEAFALMQIEDFEAVVSWGVSTDGCGYFRKESGYPGFGMPMLIVVEEAIPCFVGEVVELQTTYGDYYYSVEGTEDAILQGSNVISRNREVPVVDWKCSKEWLFIYSHLDGTVITAKLVGGTEIVA